MDMYSLFILHMSIRYASICFVTQRNRVEKLLHKIIFVCMNIKYFYYSQY